MHTSRWCVSVKRSCIRSSIAVVSADHKVVVVHYLSVTAVQNQTVEEEAAVTAALSVVFDVTVLMHACMQFSLSASVHLEVKAGRAA